MVNHDQGYSLSAYDDVMYYVQSILRIMLMGTTTIKQSSTQVIGSHILIHITVHYLEQTCNGQLCLYLIGLMDGLIDVYRYI